MSAFVRGPELALVALLVFLSACSDSGPVGPQPPVAEITLEPGTVTLSQSGHGCAVTREGDILCWGTNAFGRLGIGDADADDEVTPRPPTPVHAPDGVSFKAVAAGVFHTCALSTEHEVYCWGPDLGTLLGADRDAPSTTPVHVPVAGDARVEKVVAGGDHTCALTGDGRVYCWGGGDRGQLGNGSMDYSSLPAPIQGVDDETFVDVAAGYDHTCAVTEGGAAYCWGGSFLVGFGESVPLPRRVQVPSRVRFAQIEAYHHTTCALAPEGQAYCWGDWIYDVGDDRMPVPIQVRSPVTGSVAFLTLTVGDRHACGVTGTGELYCWGSNASPQVEAPGRRFSAIAAGNRAKCGVSATDGAILCWGSRYSGQLGDGTSGYVQTPVSIGLDGLTGMDVSPSHACATDTNGAVYCWGVERYGGSGDAATAMTPQRRAADLDEAVTTVAAGQDFNCVLTTEGEAHCWGWGHHGGLGHGAFTHARAGVAVQMPEGVTFTRLSAASNAACAIGSDERVYCWGRNTDAHPVEVPLPDGVSAHSVAVGLQHTCAVSPEGTAYCWGGNDHGQLGTGDEIAREVPTAVAAPVAFRDIVAGTFRTCALARNDEAYCWGSNARGELGVGDSIDRSIPTPVAGGHAFRSLAAGLGATTCGITPNDTALCWGANHDAQHGNGTLESTTEPVPAASGLRLEQIRVGGWGACGITTDGAGYCWGDREWGAIGDGIPAEAAEPIQIARR